MGKKHRCIAVRLEEEDFGFLAHLAAELELPTDGRPIIGRAVQALIRFMRTSVGVAEFTGQGKQCKQRLQGASA